ncbi:hypothetical protein [Romboutsia sp.]|uniref:hypothetical protein n=1 Tax=Romboutsia sp. TaxID=1965302 RepID=UPI003F3819F7
MNNIESLQLYKDLLLTSDTYSNLQLRNDIKEIESNRKLHSRLNQYHSNMDDINNKCTFIFHKTKEDIKDLDTQGIENAIISLNTFSSKRYRLLKELPIESTTTKAVLFSTIDELILINESIENKDYLNNQSDFLYLYKKVTANAFATFLALKEMELDEDAMNAFSQAIFNQIKVVSMITS